MNTPPESRPSSPIDEGPTLYIIYDLRAMRISAHLAISYTCRYVFKVAKIIMKMDYYVLWVYRDVEGFKEMWMSCYIVTPLPMKVEDFGPQLMSDELDSYLTGLREAAKMAYLCAMIKFKWYEAVFGRLTEVTGTNQ